MKKKKVPLIVLLLTSQLAICSTLWAREFIVGVQDFENYLPYSAYRDGQYQGFNRELLDLFATKYGYKFSYKPLPLKRLYYEFLTGRVDLKYPDNPYWSSDSKQGKVIAYSAPVIDYIDGVMVLERNLGKGVKNLKRLGVVMGFTPFAYLEFIHNKEIDAVESPNLEALLTQVKRGWTNGAYLNIAVGEHFQENLLGLEENIVFDESLPHTKSTRHLSALKYPEIINDFNLFLAQSPGDIAELKKKYSLD